MQVAHIAVSEFRRAIDIRARAIVYLIKSMSGLVNRRAFFLPAVLLLAGLGELGSFLFFVGVLHSKRAERPTIPLCPNHRSSHRHLDRRLDRRRRCVPEDGTVSIGLGLAMIDSSGALRLTAEVEDF